MLFSCKWGCTSANQPVLFTNQQELYRTCLEGAYHEIDIFQEQDMSLLSLKILYLWISQNPQRRTNQYYSKILNSQLEVISTLWYLRSAFHNLETMMLLIECIHLWLCVFCAIFYLQNFFFQYVVENVEFLRKEKITHVSIWSLATQ